jgi:UDP-N-acetylmuramoyl-L-alanyl-D-glutamate--2,6-diaminopimelate ligase
MKLAELLTGLLSLESVDLHPALEQMVMGLSTNSQTVKPGDVFIGMPGTKVDGGIYWPQAIANGAIAAIVSPGALGTEPNQDGQALVMVSEDLKTLCGAIATKFFDYPANKLTMVGITGTNGKTTSSLLVEYFLQHQQQPVALMGTIMTRWPGFTETASHTTPFPVDLQSLLAQAAKAGVTHGVMEVSSHALDQQRVDGCLYDVAIFTNLTQDHLDYHKDMEDYFQAKSLLFTKYLRGKAVINLDDPYGQRLIASLPPAKVWSYSVSDPNADFYTSAITYGSQGVKGKLHHGDQIYDFESPLVGAFNIANVLGTIAAGIELGLTIETLLRALVEFPGVSGRMERVEAIPDQDFTVIVDYAHTPDSLENLLKAARPFIEGQLICVFGCGGDRDRTKRPLMGAIAAELSDQAIVTSDNPRTEDPELILQDVVAGIDPSTNPLVVCDRAEAIYTAIVMAKPGDGIVIAGKGHEDYQIIGTEKIHFDDREQARKYIAQKLASVSP